VSSAGAIYLPAPGFVPDPGGLAKAYAALFKRKGGRFFCGQRGDARASRRRVACCRGPTARRRSRAKAVVALGALVRPGIFVRSDISIPLGVKRGYHLHLAPRGQCRAPIIPCSIRISAYMLAPMNRGIRLTTGVEFARRDGAADGRSRLEAGAAGGPPRRLFPLGDALDAKGLDGRAAVFAGHGCR